MMEIISLSPPISDYKVKIHCWEIELIELTEPSDTLDYNPFFKHCILLTILHVFLLLIFVWNKIFFSKN